MPDAPKFSMAERMAIMIMLVVMPSLELIGDKMHMTPLQPLPTASPGTTAAT